MLTLILLLLGVMISSLSAYLSCKYDKENRLVISILLGVICMGGLIGSCCSLVNIKTRFAETKEQCLNAKAIAESYDNSDKDRIEALDLMQLVYEENNTIIKHRTHSQSLWDGLWYSEEIGNLPLITLQKVKQVE